MNDETRFYYDQAIAAQRRMEGLEAENERLRAWLRAMVDATVKVEKPCGWCVELQGWAVEALTGTPFDAAVVRDER